MPLLGDSFCVLPGGFEPANLTWGVCIRVLGLSLNIIYGTPSETPFSSPLTQVLVVDEVYSLSSDIFDHVAALGQELRKTNPRFFLLFVGDFMQLPPVGGADLFQQESEPEGTRSPVQHMFAGTAWRNFPSLLLTEVVRQTPGDLLAKFAALGWVFEPTDAQLDELVGIVQTLAHARQRVPEDARYCACKTNEVKAHNDMMEEKLRKDRVDERTYAAVDSGDSSLLRACPLLSMVTFMVGMIVMLVVNLDTQAHFVNGLIGRVVGVDATSITVEFFGGRVRRALRYDFKVVDWISNKVLAVRSQIPLVPAFGLTVHKQQGSTVREPIRMDMRGMGVRPKRGNEQGWWTDVDRRAFLYVACTRPVRRDLLVLSLTDNQKSPDNLKQIFRAGLDVMKEFVSVLKENNILPQHM